MISSPSRGYYSLYETHSLQDDDSSPRDALSSHRRPPRGPGGGGFDRGGGLLIDTNPEKPETTRLLSLHFTFLTTSSSDVL